MPDNPENQLSQSTLHEHDKDTDIAASSVRCSGSFNSGNHLHVHPEFLQNVRDYLDTRLARSMGRSEPGFADFRSLFSPVADLPGRRWDRKATINQWIEYPMAACGLRRHCRITGHQ